MENNISEKQLNLDAEKLKQDQIKILADMQMAKEESVTQRIKAEAERYAKQVDMVMKNKDMHHRHFKEAIELHHQVHMPRNNSEAN